MQHEPRAPAVPVAAQRAAGYDTPVSPVITITGLATLLLAPFCAYALKLAAITAAICMGREAHEDPRQRWLASAAAGVFYIVIGLMGGAVVGLITAFPKRAGTCGRRPGTAGHDRQRLVSRHEG